MSKKSFRDNPALQFMSRVEKDISGDARGGGREEAKGTQGIKEAADNFRAVSPVAFEAKSKRFNMLMRPSVFASLREISENKGTSVNDLINTAVENYIKTHGK
jgi:hypothetical protein